MSKGELPKIQHYVPRLILKNFCIEDNDHLFVFDKPNGEVFQTNIKNIAAEKGFYDLELDGLTATVEFSLSELEGNVSPIIRRIIDEESLVNISMAERKLLSYFFAAQLVRVKQVRNTYKQVNSVVTDLVEKLGFDPKDNPDLNKDEDDFKASSILGLENMVNELAPYFLNKDWILFKAPDNFLYYISDNPVTLHNNIDYGPIGNLGLAVKGIQIYFPISKSYSLGFICKSYKEIVDNNIEKLGLLKKFEKDIKPNTYQEHLETLNYKNCIETGIAFQSKSENVIHKNFLQVINSTRFLFSANDDFDLAKKIINDHPEIKNPPQIQHKP
jgi:hypothetical protein